MLNLYAIKILKKSHLTIVPTSYFKEKVLEYYPFLNPKKIFVSPSAGIESNKFYFKGNKDFTKNSITIGFVSRFIEEKGWKTFLEALVILKRSGIPFNAIMAGKGPDESKILDYISKHKLETHLEFLGLVKQERLIDIYNDLDLYIFPTYREAESLGLTGLEAMSCGTAVASCNVSGPTTYIKHNLNGFLFPPKATDALVEIITHYYHLTEEEKRNLSREALKTAKEYDSKIVSEKLLKKLKEITI
ncbi:glycosyltransferase family 4 protein [Gaetbulibacter sp. PBL-D1]|uniref:glycosyltransferase family 4 protein n=1 Tax=Gaetbulibacter sp. PBL-D1 TaxID=3422594 RepID=UPI003D2EF40D